MRRLRLSSKTKETKGQRRPRVAPVWRRRPALLALGMALVVATTAGGWLAWSTGLPQQAEDSTAEAVLHASASLGFVVHDIFVVGRTATPKATLLKALAVHRDSPIFGVDLEAARERVQALPWVREASVRRVLPGTIIVEITERRPLAIWQHDRKFALIDDEGVTIQRDDVSNFRSLMVVVGEDAPANAAALVQMLATQPELMNRVQAAVRVGGRRWNVRLRDGIDIKLPEKDPDEAWKHLAELQRVHKLLDKSVRTVDLRLPDRLVIQPAVAGTSPEGNDA